MVFQTHDAQSYYSEKIQRKSSIIPNPLDTAKLPERYAGEREKRIVAAGRFSEEKNFALLIDGFATFHESFPDYTLTIYGEGALRKDYEMQIQELGLGGSVKLPGFASNLPEEINKAEETKVEEESLAAEETRMISDEARWYVVHTYSGYENKVKANIVSLFKWKIKMSWLVQ